MAETQRLWSREELILAFNLYLKIEFGKMHKGNPQIITLASMIGRTPSAISMRLVNFASLDPYHQQRGIGGLKNSGTQVQQIWDEFFQNQEELVFESERILAESQNLTIEKKYDELLFDLKDLKGETKLRMVKTRVNQSVFRQIVLNNYSNKCAITGIDLPELLFASHILPWSQHEKERLNPENGICLSALYDRAFDKGYIGFDKDYKVLLSTSLKKKKDSEYYSKYFEPVENKILIQPIKYLPKPEFLEHHRDVIFDKR
ncbi:HNH endonuclease [Flavobacterium sp. DGU11]|uniref:HNH endonuclease n=1 Tax=Flavobacterium arundinis TaxID=3139143 RepID=A0ABU9HYA2_9FLAO